MITEATETKPVVAYVTTTCPYCRAVVQLFTELGVDAAYVEFDKMSDGMELRRVFNETYGVRTVPQVFVGGARVGGCDDTMAAHSSGKLKELLAGVGIAIN